MTAPDSSAAGRHLPGIDHPLILVRDIDAVRGFYARLGFTVTPVGWHPWGTSTSLAVLRRSALELMSIYDERLIDGYAAGDFRFGRHMRDALAEREGISLVALHSQDPAGDRAIMEARGAVFQGGIEFRRKVRPPGGEWDEAVVSLQVSCDPGLPRVSHFLAQQHKPQLLWVPEWMQHANGATHVAAVHYRAREPEPVLHRLASLFGRDRITTAPGGWQVATGQGVFGVIRAGEEDAVIGAGPLPRMGRDEAAAIAIDVAVSDLPAAGRLLATAGIAASEMGGSLAIDDVASCGNVLLRFVPGAR
jgi:catechol 2,3-dioxygenase-like lactoylglutathione lyase family enzyme